MPSSIRARSGRECGDRSGRARNTSPCAFPTTAPAFRKPELKRIFKRFYRVPGPLAIAREGYRPGSVHRAFGRQAAWRARMGGERRSGPRQHVRPAVSGGEMSRVLVVEDEQHLAEGLRFNLEAEGYQVERGRDRRSSARGAGRPHPAFDVMVLDVMLPGKDGFTVMSELRQAGQFVPTLMLTARGHPDDVLRGLRCRRRRLSHQAVRTGDSDRAHPRPAAPPRVAARVAWQQPDRAATRSLSATSR